MKTLILDLFDKQVVQFGTFTLKSGIHSPIYLDLRIIISYPSLLKQIAHALWHKVRTLSFDQICPVPYTAIPIATALSLAHDLPMLMRRKEAKEHGTKRSVEGVFTAGQSCLVIEDVISTGGSILETVTDLERGGLCVRNVAVIIDRQQGGKEHLEAKGIEVRCLLTLSEILHVLHEDQRIDEPTVQRVREFLIHQQQTLRPL